MNERKFVYIEEFFVPFCYVCGRETKKILKLKVFCPNCVAPITMNVCVECAEKLRDELTSVLNELKRGEK